MSQPKLHEQALEFAKQGLTNVEIFCLLGLSPAHLIKIAVSDTPLLFSIVRGRVEAMKPYLEALADEALVPVGKDSNVRNIRALLTAIDRFDRENKMLGVSYDMSLLTATPAPSEKQLRGAELTKLLREKHNAS